MFNASVTEVGMLNGAEVGVLGIVMEVLLRQAWPSELALGL